MTIDEFLAKLSETKANGWSIRDGGGPIRDCRGRCPLEAAANVGRWKYEEAASILEFGPRLRDRIAAAADLRNNYRHSHYTLRRRLLTAVGLTEDR